MNISLRNTLISVIVTILLVFIGTWYNGYSSSDNIHPTKIGSKVIVLRYLIDVPEIMNIEDQL